MVVGREIRFADEGAAAKRPKLIPAWSVACWTLFWCALALNVWGILSFAPMRLVDGRAPGTGIALVLPVLAVLIAINTQLAALGFGARARQTAAFIASADRVAREAVAAGEGGSLGRVGFTDGEFGGLTVDARRVEQQGWNISAGGRHRPGPNWSKDPKARNLMYDIAAYREFIAAERRAAQASAAKLAAALAMMFLMGFQVVLKLS